ncbi:hypothetical protein SD960_06335 [Flavobacterium sp. MMLR14_040]|uniref:hypothetical protein n=1 Tax=Flavobacterium sp. MMLR14_040 TaxID=3093843 RepID=UPI00298F4E94|nr:hypothetical protein [Flavobacterium sp. MMLR14_040]MDW8849703.1 hypothetical protein [Flavobacterium sp. MMLR14_040]
MIKELKNKFYRYLIFIFFLGFVFSSCENEKKVNILKTYFPKDKQIVFSEYIIKNGDTILDGNYIVRKYDGIKIKSGVYKNGRAIGPLIFYFNNGNIESIDYKNEKRLSQETKYYYESGKIKKYALSDDLGNTAFIIKYDESGDINSYEGLVLMEVYQYKIAHQEGFKIKINQYLKVGDTLKYKYLLANIPNTKRSFKIENIDVDNSKVKRILRKIPPVESDVKEVLTKKGINTIRAIVKYEFNDKEKTVIKDTISFKVMVN